MNSVKIGTYQMDTAFGLYLPEYTIPAPAPQTKFVKIIGRDGSVDLSDAIGLHYDSRSWSLDFKCFDPTVNWHTLTSSVMNAIHGKRLNFEFDDDPDYFWTGRISVSSYVSNRGTGTLRVNITSDPYKYKKLSTIVTKTAFTGTEYTGSLVTFNTANAQIYDLSSAINYSQDLHGYSSPWPAGGGKNLFNKDGTDENNGYVYGKYLNYLGQETTPGSGTWFISEYIPIGSEVNYALSGLGSVATVPSLCFYDSSKAFIIGVTYQGRASFASTTPSGAAYARLSAGPSSTEVNTIQLELGSTATSWTPYSNICPITGRTGVSVYVGPTQDQQDATTYAVDWTTQAGTVYGGTLDVVTGVLTVDRAYKAFDGTEDWGLVNGAYFMTVVEPLYSVVNNSAISTHYPLNPSISVGNYQTGFSFYNRTASPYTGAIVLVRPEAPLTTSLADFKAWLATQNTNGTPFAVCYELATPITYQLSAQEIEALVGTNNIWTSSGDVSVTVVTPETVTNNGLPAVPTVTASADMVLRWGNYSASVQQGTSTIPQLVLETGDNHICIIGTGNISFEWSEASL